VRLLSFAAWFHDIQLRSHLIASSQPSSTDEVPDTRNMHQMRTERAGPNRVHHSQNWVCIIFNKVFAGFHCQFLKRVPNSIVLAGWCKMIAFRIRATLFSSFSVYYRLKGSIASVQQRHIFVKSPDDEDSSATPQAGM
jgi:hypothetical protein